MISPLPYSADFRPYFTIHDEDFGALVGGQLPDNSNALPRLLGVTNLYFLKAGKVQCQAVHPKNHNEEFCALARGQLPDNSNTLRRLLGVTKLYFLKVCERKLFPGACHFCKASSEELSSVCFPKAPRGRCSCQNLFDVKHA